VAPFTHPLRVRFGECDPQGIVFNAHYVAYFDVAVTELWREALGSWGAMNERGVDVVVGEVSARFHAPARADELLELRAWIESFGTTSMRLRVDVAREGFVLVEGLLRYVFVDAASWAPIPIPDWIREGLAPYAGTNEVGTGRRMAE
jgi:acyl-CoA thioester hydrolase